jgi:hypothetical protein
MACSGTALPFYSVIVNIETVTSQPTNRPTDRPTDRPTECQIIVISAISFYGSGGRAVPGIGLGRLVLGLRARIPLEAWIFVFVFLCRVVLCR